MIYFKKDTVYWKRYNITLDVIRVSYDSNFGNRKREDVSYSYTDNEKVMPFISICYGSHKIDKNGDVMYSPYFYRIWFENEDDPITLDRYRELYEHESITEK